MRSRPYSARLVGLASFAIFWFALALFFLARPVYARVVPRLPANAVSSSRALDVSTTNVVVALTPMTRTSPVELVALTLDADISESAGHTIASGNTTFKLHNSDVFNPVSMTVGFPEWAGGALSFSPDRFADFRVTSLNKRILLTLTPGPVRIGQETRTVNWYAFDLQLAPDEKQLVRVDFAQDLGTGVFPRFTYGLLPSNGWKGPIGSARLSVQLPRQTIGEQFIALDPSIPQFDGDKLTWLWTNFDPPADPGVTFIRDSTWVELLNRRAAVSAKPNDASLHTAAARIYQELAAPDSPRRDNFTSQAVAELETAARLDPKNLDAALALGDLYETRAGPANSPRDENYVVLALAQWKRLIGSRLDADARKHAAEDSFYLGIVARGRGDYDQALAYFSDAIKTSPQGAGPFFTREHWQTEMAAAHIALAQSDVAQEQITEAIDHARAAFPDFDLAPAPLLPSFALDRATITTRSGERHVSLRLVPYPGVSEEAKKVVEKTLAALNATGAASVTLVPSETDYGLEISIPFGDASDLQNRLEILAHALPQNEDWDAIGGILQSPSIEFEERSDMLSHAVRFREEIDLATGLAPLQSRLNETSRTIGELEGAPANDDRAGLRLLLLRHAQSFWQSTLSTGRVTYELQPAYGSIQRWTIPLGKKQTLVYESTATRTEVYVAGVGAAVFALFLFTLALFWLSRAARRRRERAG